MGKCKYNTEWEGRTDPNGHVVRLWGSKHSQTEMKCSACRCTFSCTGGWRSVVQHCQTKSHQDKSAVALAPGQMKLIATTHPNSSVAAPHASDSSVTAPHSSDSSVAAPHSSDSSVAAPHSSDSSMAATASAASRTVQLYNVRDSAAKAELFWVMKCIKSNFSFNSCSDLEAVFRSMFSTGVPEGFSLGSTKATYLLTDALEPYFAEELTHDAAGSYYSLAFDETCNSACQKELQCLVTYWSRRHSGIVTRHLRTFFIGHARADDLQSKIYTALEDGGFPRSKLVMLSKDGPNVNKSVERKINDDLLEERGKKLLDLGSCNVDIAHNAFLAGLGALGEDASDFVICLHNFFHDWPARWEDFREVQHDLKLEHHKFIKHVESRWLTLEAAADRAVEQMPAVREYFLKFLPRQEEKKAKNSRLTEKKSYRSIVAHLKSPTLLAELLFVSSSARMFAGFTKLFQRDDPLVHLLYTELKQLALKMIRRTCTEKAVKEYGLKEAVLEEKNLLSLDVMLRQCDEKISAELMKDSVNEKHRLLFISNMRQHYIKACKHLLIKSALKPSVSPLARNFTALQPNERGRTTSASQICGLASALPLDIQRDILVDEWSLLRSEKERLPSTSPIDKYWGQFFELKSSSGDPKYPTVTAVVKAALTCAHGNAGVERGFSDSALTLTDSRASMSERTLNATQTVKSALKAYGGDLSQVPITKELLTKARLAHGNYLSYLQKQKEEKQRREEVEREALAEKFEQEKTAKRLKEEKKTLEEDEKKLTKLRSEEQEKRTLAATLLSEANARLKKGTESKNMMEVQLAEGMLSGVETYRKDADAKSKAIDVLQRSVDKRKNALISKLTDCKKQKRE